MAFVSQGPRRHNGGIEHGQYRPSPSLSDDERKIKRGSRFPKRAKFGLLGLTSNQISFLLGLAAGSIDQFKRSSKKVGDESGLSPGQIGFAGKSKESKLHAGRKEGQFLPNLTLFQGNA